MTDLIIEAAAMLQRTEIEEQLFKLRLKQKCFVALATRAPVAALEVRSDFPAEDSDQVPCTVSLFHFRHDEHEAPAVTSPPVSFDPHNPYPKGRW